MKDLTQEERQARIALCRIEITRWRSVPDKTYMLELMEIALAALTAEPAFYLHESDLPKIKSDCGATVWAHLGKTDGDVPYYTAPITP